MLLITIDTLRADHMSLWGYGRETTPCLDALASSGVTFEQAYPYWPKTRGSFVAMMTGRLAADSGYGKSHPRLVDFNPPLRPERTQPGRLLGHPLQDRRDPDGRRRALRSLRPRA